MTARYRDCAWCGQPFLAKTIRAIYCRDTHRALAGKARRVAAAAVGVDPYAALEPAPAPSATVDLADPAVLEQLAALVAARLGASAAPAAPTVEDDPTNDVALDEPPAPTGEYEGPVEKATRAQLRDADRLDTPTGRAALVLAIRLDNSQGETLSALAAGSKALQERLAAALGHAQPAPGAQPTAAPAAGAPAAAADPLAAARARREALGISA